MDFILSSPAFADGGAIPSKYTCAGDDISPELVWENPPDATRSFALVCDDPDAPGATWVHWVIWGIPPALRNLPEGVPLDPVLDTGASQGITDFRRLGYGGPCPPGGKSHRYFFKLYALDAAIQLPPGSTREELLEAMEDHVLAEVHLVGTFKNRVGGGLTPSVLSHHRTYDSVYGGS